MSKYTLNGQRVTVQEIATRAGCSKGAMHKRLTRDGMTPEQAVAAGPQLRPGGKPAPKRRAKALTVVKLDHMGAKLDRQAEVIVPADVKRTVAPPIPERFSTAGALPLFSALKAGEYLPGDTHMAQVYGGKA